MTSSMNTLEISDRRGFAPIGHFRNCFKSLVRCRFNDSSMITSVQKIIFAFKDRVYSIFLISVKTYLMDYQVSFPCSAKMIFLKFPKLLQHHLSQPVFVQLLSG